MTLQQIFTNRLFRIPDHQRGYAWRSDVEIVDFWNDLMNLSAQKSHFTGSLTLQETTSTDFLGFDREMRGSREFIEKLQQMLNEKKEQFGEHEAKRADNDITTIRTDINDLCADIVKK